MFIDFSEDFSNFMKTEKIMRVVVSWNFQENAKRQ